MLCQTLEFRNAAKGVAATICRDTSEYSTIPVATLRRISKICLTKYRVRRSCVQDGCMEILHLDHRRDGDRAEAVKEEQQFLLSGSGMICLLQFSP